MWRDAPVGAGMTIHWQDFLATFDFNEEDGADCKGAIYFGGFRFALQCVKPAISISLPSLLRTGGKGGVGWHHPPHPTSAPSILQF